MEKKNIKISRYTLRVPQELLDKLEYIASYYGRSKNKELERMIISRIKGFENKHGEITIPPEHQE